MFGAIALIAALLQQAPDPCAHDRDRLLALELRAFDQDMSGGWRPLASNTVCRLAAADLIRDYRALHRTDDHVLVWHEGQLRALEGQTEAAITLMERAHRRDEDVIGWNHYVDATLAFLRGDRDSLQQARARLAATPRPPDFAPRDADGQPAQVRWPMNLHIVDNFLACFGRSYADAMWARCGSAPEN